MAGIREKIKRCTECGKRTLDIGFKNSSPIYTIMKEKQICYDCAYWISLMDNPFDGMEIINYVCYRVLPYIKKTATMTLGGKGKTRYILKKDKTVIKSNDVWMVGEVPMRFRDRLKNTAWFVTRDIYKRMSHRFFACKNKGCMDRYHCFRWDYRTEFNDNGPYNTVPRTWIVGEEFCPAFVNINKITGFDEYINIDDILNDEKQFR